MGKLVLAARIKKAAENRQDQDAERPDYLLAFQESEIASKSWRFDE